jgi:hypothetical protein
MQLHVTATKIWSDGWRASGCMVAVSTMRRRRGGPLVARGEDRRLSRELCSSRSSENAVSSARIRILCDTSDRYGETLTDGSSTGAVTCQQSRSLEARTASVSVGVGMIGARCWRVTSVTHTHPCKNGSTASRPGSWIGAMMQEAGESSRKFLEYKASYEPSASRSCCCLFGEFFFRRELSSTSNPETTTISS